MVSQLAGERVSESTRKPANPQTRKPANQKMIPVAQIKKDLTYNLDLADIIEVLKMIASSEFRNLSFKAEKEDVFKERIISCFALLSGLSKKNQFFIERKGIPKAFLMVCSDEGFLGEVNTLVADTALMRGLKDGARFIVLGERGSRILKDSGLKFVSFPSVQSDIKMEHTREVSNYILDLYKEEQISSFYVVYMKFISFTRHHIDIVKLLPCDELLGYIKEKEKDTPENLIEPDHYSVIEYLVKLWLENKIYNIYWSSRLSELSIRVMHLEHSSEELKGINRDLKFQYFKSIHSLNDKVIREIFAARTLL